MAHIPVNHPLQPAYRALAGLAGLYILLFGIVGLIETWGESFFSQDDLSALGLHTNPAFSVLSIIAGVVVVGSALVGGNQNHLVNLGVAVVFMVAGMLGLLLVRSSADFLNFSVATCVVSFIIGIVLLAAGLYGKVGTPEEAEAEQEWRLGSPGRVVKTGTGDGSGGRHSAG